MSWVYKFIKEVDAWLDFGFNIIPGTIGILLRRLWYGLKFASSRAIIIEKDCEFVLSKNISFQKGVSIAKRGYFNADGGQIFIGEAASFNIGTHINASCGGVIKIGDNCLIGPGVVMRTANHRYSNQSKLIRDQGHEFKNIIIESDCWLGTNVVILPGVTVGKGAVIGAGSIVTKDVPPYALAVGVPARVIKFRT